MLARRVVPPNAPLFLYPNLLFSRRPPAPACPVYPEPRRVSQRVTPLSSSHPKPFLSRQHHAPITPLDATPMDYPASVANKRLTPNLTPLDATLTKNTGWGPTFLRFGAQTFPTFRPAFGGVRRAGVSPVRSLSFQAFAHSSAAGSRNESEASCPHSLGSCRELTARYFFAGMKCASFLHSCNRSVRHRAENRRHKPGRARCIVPLQRARAKSKSLRQGRSAREAEPRLRETKPQGWGSRGSKGIVGLLRRTIAKSCCIAHAPTPHKQHREVQ